MTTALDAISAIVSLQMPESSPWFTGSLIIIFAAGIVVIGSALVKTRFNESMGFVAMLGVAAVGAIGTGIAGAIDVGRQQEAVGIETLELCRIAMNGIVSGEVKVLRLSDADKLAKECGARDFLAAANSETSKLRLASR